MPIDPPSPFSVRDRALSALRGIRTASFASGAVSILVLGGAYMVFAQDDALESSTDVALVERRDIVTSVKATGTVAFAREQQLKFNQRGRVVAVNVKDGDAVKKGQVLAELDKTSVQSDIRQAQLSLSTSVLQLQELQGDRESQLWNAESAVRDAERQFTNAQNTLGVALEKLPADVAAAERAVQQKEVELVQARANELQRLAASAQSVYAGNQDILDTLYGVLVNDTAARRSADQKTIEIYFRLYNDYTLKNRVEFAYYTALKNVQAMDDTYGRVLPTLRDPVIIERALHDGKAAASSLATLSDETYALLQGANADPSTFTVDDVNTAKSAVTAARAKATDLINSADEALASMTGDATSIAVRTAEDALLKAREALAVLETQTPGDLLQQEQSVAKMQDTYHTQESEADRTARSLDIQIRLKQNDIAQKSAALAKSAKVGEDYQIVAPFDGVVRRVDYQVGDNLLADIGEEQEIVLENPEFIIVTVLLDQSDVVRVQEGMSASIVFDALSNQTFTGTIDEISPTPVEQSGVVSYEVTVKLPTPADVTILSGMTAIVTIETARRNAVVAVPNLALQRTNGMAAVQLPAGDSVPVETGVTDGRYTEILSGVNEGDTVLSVNVAVGSSATPQGANNPNAAQQLFRMGGGSPPGGGTSRR